MEKKQEWLYNNHLTGKVKITNCYKDVYNQTSRVFLNSRVFFTLLIDVPADQLPIDEYKLVIDVYDGNEDVYYYMAIRGSSEAVTWKRVVYDRLPAHVKYVMDKIASEYNTCYEVFKT
jgi:hypothetical protein